MRRLAVVIAFLAILVFASGPPAEASSSNLDFSLASVSVVQGVVAPTTSELSLSVNLDANGDQVLGATSGGSLMPLATTSNAGTNTNYGATSCSDTAWTGANQANFFISAGLTTSANAVSADGLNAAASTAATNSNGNGRSALAPALSVSTSIGWWGLLTPDVLTE